MTDRKESIEEQIKAGKIEYYMCDPSCGLRILSEDGI